MGLRLSHEQRRISDWVAERANHTHAAVEKWWTHVDSIGWPVGKAPQDSNAIYILTTSFGVLENGPDSSGQRASESCFGKTPKAPMASCHGRGASRWHGTSRGTSIPTPTSATQPWKQELQPALPPPTRPTIQPTIRNSHLHSSGH